MIELIDIKDRRRMHRLINIYLLSSNRANLCTFTVLFQIIQCHLSYRKVRFIGLLNDFTSKVILKIFFFKRPKNPPNLILIIISLVVNKKVQRHIIFLPWKHVLLHF